MVLYKNKQGTINHFIASLIYLLPEGRMNITMNTFPNLLLFWCNCYTNAFINMQTYINQSMTWINNLPYLENDNWSAGNKNSVVSSISPLLYINFNENIVPLGSGGNNMIVAVTSVQKVLMYREKGVSNYQQSTMNLIIHICCRHDLLSFMTSICNLITINRSVWTLRRFPCQLSSIVTK